MTRPKCCYKIGACPKATFFKPQNIPSKDLKTVYLNAEEAEALRLKDVEDLDQTKAADRMNVSQSTFQRVLKSARKKLSEALIEGKAIQIDIQKSK